MPVTTGQVFLRLITRWSRVLRQIVKLSYVRPEEPALRQGFLLALRRSDRVLDENPIFYII